MTETLPLAPSLPLPLVEEKFCMELARHNDMRLAWRAATGEHGASNAVAARMATEMYSRPGVEARVIEIRQQVADLSGLNVATILQHWFQLAIADPTEIMQYRRTCCRYCWGFDFQYQWTEQEYAAATAKAIDMDKPVPELAGGYGYDGSKGPNPVCPACFGEGEGHIYIADTRYLSDRGKLLFAGIEQNKYGVKVHLHDQQEAWVNLARFFSMFQEKINIEDITPRTRSDKPAESLAELPLEVLVAKFRELTAPESKGQGRK